MHSQYLKKKPGDRIKFALTQNISTTSTVLLTSTSRLTTVLYHLLYYLGGTVVDRRTQSSTNRIHQIFCFFDRGNSCQVTYSILVVS